MAVDLRITLAGFRGEITCSRLFYNPSHYNRCKSLVASLSVSLVEPRGAVLEYTFSGRASQSASPTIVFHSYVLEVMYCNQSISWAFFLLRCTYNFFSLQSCTMKVSQV